MPSLEPWIVEARCQTDATFEFPEDDGTPRDISGMTLNLIAYTSGPKTPVLFTEIGTNADAATIKTIQLTVADTTLPVDATSPYEIYYRLELVSGGVPIVARHGTIVIEGY
jgi:hypothetical protein